MRVNCFKPVIDGKCTVLILGSMPSVKSREAGFYYGNPANRFWKIMSAILNTDFTALDNAAKAAELIKKRIALSDVFSTCDIDGSMDGNIKNTEFNDIPALIDGTEIKTVYITSKKAYRAFVGRFGEHFKTAGMEIVSLPSTSGANRSKFKTDEQLLAEWKRLFKI